MFKKIEQNKAFTLIKLILYLEKINRRGALIWAIREKLILKTRPISLNVINIYTYKIINE